MRDLARPATGKAVVAAWLGASALAAAPACGQAIVYDNGFVNGSCGDSNATAKVFGARRTLLDDFVIPDGQTWRLTGFRHKHIWNTLAPGSGTGMEIAIWTDAGGRPGMFDFALHVSDYQELVTGRTFFSRREAVSWTSYDAVDFAPGHYWWEATIVGAEINFWLCADQQNEECWVNYDDLGGLQSGREIFGMSSDLNWALGGRVLLPLSFAYPGGRPEAIDPCGDAVRVKIVGELGQGLDPRSPTLHFDAGGGGFVAVPMEQVSFARYDAVFPPIACGTEVSYFLSAETLAGETVRDPPDAPANVFSTISSRVRVPFADDMEHDPGWTVRIMDLDEGKWQRGVPVASPGAPRRDYDGSGQCWLTGNAEGSEVDGGPTDLISPSFDLSGEADPVIRYARWFFNDNFDTDRLEVAVSNDGGATWTTVERVPHRGGWEAHAFRVLDLISPLTARMRLRFTTSDPERNSLTEAAVDAVEVLAFTCEVPGDVNGDGNVNIVDLVLILVAWGPCEHEQGCPEDLDGSGEVDLADLLIVLSAWGPCP